MTTPLRIVVADGSGEGRQGLCDLLNAQPGLQVVAAVADGMSACQAAADLRPAVAIVALAGQGLDGLRTAEKIKQRLPFVPLVIFSDHPSPGYAESAWAAGAAAYVTRQAGPLELVRAIRNAAPVPAKKRGTIEPGGGQ
jgi:DNA-binding NarL/FixJ family response regulator